MFGKLNGKKLRERMDARVFDDIANGRIGGSAVLVKQNGETVMEALYGERIPGEGVPITIDTVWRLASMTKPVTAVATLLQVADGKLQLDMPIASYLPAYAHLHTGKLVDGKIQIGPEILQPVLVRDLLCHASGIGSDQLGSVVMEQMSPSDMQTLETVVSYHASQPLAFVPRSAQAYSPVVAFDILARLVELTSGQSYDSFLAERLFKPLGMTDTGFQPRKDQWARMAGMHKRTEDAKNETAHEMDQFIFGGFPLTYFCGGAGLFSTLRDYSRFAEMLLCEGKTQDGDCILPAEWIAAMRTPQLSSDIMPGNQVWGLGVRVITGEDYPYLPVGAYGWSGAYGTHFWVDPVNRVTAVYMKNSTFDGGAGATSSVHFESDVAACFEN